VFELHTTTFQPTVSLKYGRLLPPSSPDSSSLRIQLHPSCAPPTAEDYEGTEGLEADEADVYEDEWAPKPKFGQDLLELQARGGEAADPSVWEGEWDGADVRVAV
jgi:hypothetical protein